MINEYKDDEVLKEEKVFFIMWNRFVHSNTALADSHIPKLCANFVSKYRDEIIRQHLRDQLLLHLMNMWDNQLLSWKMIIDLMYFFDYGVPKRSDNADIDDSQDASMSDDSSHRLVDIGEENENVVRSNGDRKRTLLLEENNNNGLENQIEKNNDNNLSMTVVGKISIPLEDGIKRLRTNSSAS
jgi:hypothetical protein